MPHEVLIGQTDYSVFVMMRDDAGAPATGLAHTDIDIAYARMETDNDATTTDVAPADLANLTAAHTDWGWEEVSATDHPGLYRLDAADAVFASGAWSAVVSITGTGLDPCHIEFMLVPNSPLTGVLLAPTTHTSAVIPTVTTTGTATNLTNLPTIPNNWLTAAGINADAFTAAKFNADVWVESRTAHNGGDYALSTDANGRVRIVDGTGAGELDTASGVVQADAVSFSGSTTAASNAEIVFDTDFGDNYNATDNVWKADIAFSLGEAIFNSDFTIASATATTVTLPTAYTNSGSLPDDDRHVFTALSVIGGTGAGQVVVLTTAAAGARTYNVQSGTMPVQLDNTSRCVILGSVYDLGGAGATAAEIADAVWDEDATAHQTQGSFGQAIGDPGSDSDTIWALVNTNLNATISSRSSHSATDVWAAATRTLTHLDEDSTTIDLDATITGALSTPISNIAAILADTGTDGVVVNAAGLATDAVQEIRNAITGGAYALSTDASGMVRIVDGTGTGELNTTSGAVSIIASEVRAAVGLASANLDTQLDALPTAAEVWSAGTRTLTAIDEDSTTLDLDATIRAAVGMASANLDTQLDALPTAAENAAALLDLSNGIETSVTPRQALRGIAAALFGIVQNAGSGTETFKGAGQASGGTTRLTYTVDNDGNRTAVTLNL